MSIFAGVLQLGFVPILSAPTTRQERSLHTLRVLPDGYRLFCLFSGTYKLHVAQVTSFLILLTLVNSGFCPGLLVASLKTSLNCVLPSCLSVVIVKVPIHRLVRRSVSFDQ
ncbi:unnamed protein product [Mucor hiemalis]